MPKLITVIAPARLHMGFFDLHGGLGRRFGGLGLALQELSTRLRLEPAAVTSASGPDADRARRYAERLLSVLEIDSGVRIELEDAIPAHVGLGSGTQLSLAVAAAIAAAFGVKSDLATLARHVERGDRSGIGTGAFLGGGFVVDGGRGTSTVVPPVVSQLTFPDEWRVLLVLDRRAEGLSGDSESLAFERLAPMESNQAAHLCRLVLMQILPALAEHNGRLFGDGITRLQEIVGDYFARFQGGRYSSPRVAAALDWLKSRSALGVGQSSWGPTGFALFDNHAQVREVAAAARRHWPDSLEFKICTANNSGASVRHADTAALAGGLTSSHS